METKTKAIDPVCGMEVDPEAAAGHSDHAGHTYHFCSTACKARFDAEPEVFAAAATANERAAHASHDHHRTATDDRTAYADHTSHAVHHPSTDDHASDAGHRPSTDDHTPHDHASLANHAQPAGPTQPVVQLTLGKPRHRNQSPRDWSRKSTDCPC